MKLMRAARRIDGIPNRLIDCLTGGMFGSRATGA
jgi:hypothetical protein